MVIDTISGSVIETARNNLSSPVIGRKTTEYIIKGNKVTVYEDNFNIRLWEVGAVAVAGALIYYTPRILDMIAEFWDVVPSITLKPPKTKEIPTKLFLEDPIKREGPIQEFYKEPRKDIVWPWEEDFPWFWK